MSVRKKPPYYGMDSKGKEKIIGSAPKQANQQAGPIFNRFTVVWVDTNGIPFSTAIFFARLFRGNTVVSTASFDNFGVVRFDNIRTLTNAEFTLRIYRVDGVLYRTRTIPAGVETFAVIG